MIREAKEPLQFLYPVDQNSFNSVKDSRQLLDLLQRERQLCHLPALYYKINQQKNKYMYANCRNCSASIKFKRKNLNDQYHLMHFRNFHTHRVINESQKIQEFIRSLPTTITTNCLKDLTLRQFKISSKKFYYHHRRVWQTKLTFHQIFQQLDKQDNETRYLPFPLKLDEYPDILLTATKQMVSDFQRFGQFTSFNITYNLIKQVKNVIQNEQQKARKWGVGLFLGKNHFNHAVPFAICILNIETKESLMAVFRSFLDMMGKHPETFLTDEQMAIDSALSQLKQDGEWQGSHLFDTFHILRNLRNKTKNTALINHLRSSMFEKTAGEYAKDINFARQSCTSIVEANIVQNFQRNSHRFCFSKTSSKFHGLSISTSFGEKVNDFVKGQINFARPFRYVFLKILKQMKILKERSKNGVICRIEYENIFNWNQIKLLRLKICAVAFDFFLKSYVQSLSANVSDLRSGWQVDGEVVRIENEILMCSCEHLLKCGLPCSHLCTIIKKTRENIFNYVHPRWIIQEDKQAQIVSVPLGRPRKSKRNRK